MRFILACLVVLSSLTGSAFCKSIEIPASKFKHVRDSQNPDRAILVLSFDVLEVLAGQEVLSAYLDCPVTVDSLESEEPGEVTALLHVMESSWSPESTPSQIRNGLGEVQPQKWFTQAGEADTIRLVVSDHVRHWNSLENQNYGLAITITGATPSFEPSRSESGQVRRPTLKVWVKP